MSILPRTFEFRPDLTTSCSAGIAVQDVALPTGVRFERCVNRALYLYVGTDDEMPLYICRECYAVYRGRSVVTCNIRTLRDVRSLKAETS